VGLEKVGILFEVLSRGVQASLMSEGSTQISAAMCAANVGGE
jgi:hypothetical protein